MSYMGSKCGMVGYGMYIPEGRISARELEAISGIPENTIIEKIGIKNKVAGGKEDHCVSMAIKSAQDCLKNTQIKPEEIDLIIFNGEEYKEYICWTAAIKIKKELNAINAWGFDISYRCSSTILGIKIAKDMMMANETINTVLITGGNTIAYLVDNADRKSSFMLPLTVGACSIILKKNYPRNHILETCIINESIFADDVLPRYNGSYDPRYPELAEGNGSWKIELPHYETFKKNLRERSVEAFLKAARNAMHMSRVKAEDVDYVSMVHVKRDSHEYILKALGFGLDRSNYLEDYGHIGHVDNILSLELGLQNNQIIDGSNVLMITGGLGYSFAATLIKWGKC
ncbi:3-oxoacyl-ACP synthase [Lutispora sp.]|uniref:3-oxoacyl-ACP synthase n=1 Tax=Lutispora sp. TaxID=2828727 RepID=UPI002B21A5BD|nr:3-oxoacyl-ACP synthase [Lutispora sp.]MEA4962240.1 3-oxoacyl-ACP synthase [Lutispora sp.]